MLIEDDRVGVRMRYMNYGELLRFQAPCYALRPGRAGRDAWSLGRIRAGLHKVGVSLIGNESGMIFFLICKEIFLKDWGWGGLGSWQGQGEIRFELCCSSPLTGGGLSKDVCG